MRIFKTTKGILVDHEGKYYLLAKEWDAFVNDDVLFSKLIREINTQECLNTEMGKTLLSENLLPPIGQQEIWASGVTYFRSREARMEEAREAGGGDFYDRVYLADRPELFFKSTAGRTVGSGQKVRIRKDSRWNVPEPELTLFIGSSGRILGYTCGNDMSSRDIEGENPLYLPQAKSYDKSASIGPGLYITEELLPADTTITMEILRKQSRVFEDKIRIDQIKRKFSELVEYLYRETSFRDGCFLMTGTGIVPPDDFTLLPEDEIRISIDQIGTLINYVE